MTARPRSRATRARGGDSLAAAVGRLRDVERTLLPPADAIREQLGLLGELGSMREVSIWVLDESDRLRQVAHARGKPKQGVRDIARRVVAGGETVPGPRRTLVAVPVAGAEIRPAALAARVPPGSSAESLALLAEAAPLLASVLERERLLEAERRRAEVLASTERRLARFGLDLHDGPLQEIDALVSDLRLFAGQVETRLAGHPVVEAVHGRVQDLELRALGLERELRELSRTAGASAGGEWSVGEALRAEAQAFVRATGVVPKIELVGPVEESTASQRITLLRGVQEAMRNAREHSGAMAVSVRVVASAERLEATVEDDGRGFDVARKTSRARRAGRLGLVGIEERARLLGGSSAIRSRPGGPTSIRISLPRWTRSPEARAKH